MPDTFSFSIVFSLALILFIIGILKLRAHRKIKQKGILAKGFIYEMNGRYPVVRFTTKNDEWITEEHDMTGIYEKGETLTVYYNPANPKEFFICDLRTKITPYVLIVSGTLAFIFGILATAHIVPWHT